LNQGTPLATNAPRSKLWRNLEQLAAQIKGETPREAEELEAAPAPKRKFWVFSKART